jgi:RNA polymerase sigma-70 factor (ECF subfamily)
VSHAEVGLDRKAQELVEVARQLPEHERTVVMLRYFDGHAVKDIAEILGCPVGTVTMRLSRARARLREWLKENE